MDFIKRNMPIIAIGLVTVIILVGIVVLGNKPPEQELVEVDVNALIVDHTPVTGSSTAAFTLVEFSDFECPACKAFEPAVQDLLRTYPNDIRFAYRHFPLPQHPNGRKAAEAAQAAYEQNAFWEYHDKLFENQENLEESDLLKYAQELGLDVEKFKDELDNNTHASIVQADIESGNALGVDATPTFYLNGKKLQLTSPSSLFQIVSFEIENAKQLPTTTNERPNEQTPAEKLLEQATTSFQISYNGTEFSPDGREVLIGQTVIWVNQAGRTVNLMPTLGTYGDFPETLTLAPNERFEFVMNQPGIFALRDKDNLRTGTVIVVKQEGTPEVQEEL